MLVDRYAVEAELGRELEFVEIAIIELVPFLRIEIGVRQHHPGGAIFVGETHVQISVGHEVKHEDFHRRLRFPRFSLIVRRPACFASVARFSEKGVREKLAGWGIECIEAELLERRRVEALPKLPNVVFMAGRKFGSSGQEDLTWAMNALVPALVAETFAGSRIVAYSTGCVYPYVNVHHGGATETTPTTPPPVAS